MRYANAVRMLVCYLVLGVASKMAYAEFLPSNGDAREGVAIRRTDYAIPHVQAADWTSLGLGIGYAQATDNLCSLAELFTTLRGTRSIYATLSGKPRTDSIIGRPDGIESDFFFRLIMTPRRLAAYHDAQSAELRMLIVGFVSGYNRYVDEIHAGRSPLAHRACREAPWVQHIDSADVFRRMIEISMAGGGARFVTALTHASPPRVQPSDAAPLSSGDADSSAPMLTVGGDQSIGSNAIALAPRFTDSGHSLLFGNPHWFWDGPDRFYEAQMTIPGTMDVAGAMFLGIPVIVIGFNQHVAWTHTVSTARRFGLFRLSLVSGRPTSYWLDGREESMERHVVSIDAVDASGAKHTISRTFYSARVGMLVNLAAQSDKLKWDGRYAYALRDINLTNLHAFDNYLDWARAPSLDAFIAVQRRYASVPWANTLAIGDREARVWYGDIGPVPGVPDELVRQCGLPVDDERWQAIAARVPLLDGSQSACMWRSYPDSAQRGALGVSALPQLLTPEYAANMNDSYWLTDPARPMTGLAAILGPTGTVQSLRTRLGHRIVQQRRLGTDGYPGRVFTMAILKQRVLDSTSMSALLFKNQLIAGACRQATSASAPLAGEPSEVSHAVDIAHACAVLANWRGDGNADARGADLWDDFWARASKIAPDALFKVPFDRTAPLTTPAVLNTDNPDVERAFVGAVVATRARERSFDTPRGDRLYLADGATHIPLFGGCAAAGYFTAACPQREGARAAPMGAVAHGNSYLQIVGFGPAGVDAYTLLSTSQSDDPASYHYRDASELYASKKWLHFAFAATDIERRASADSVLLGP